MKILFLSLYSILPFLANASNGKMNEVVLNICRTAVGQAGKKSKLEKDDKKKLEKCLKTVNSDMTSCLEKGKKVSFKEGGGTKKSMLKLLEVQKQTTICNLDVTINAVKKYY